MMPEREIMALPPEERVRAQFRRAEAAIKLFERLTLSANEPAINQLRYAGHHLACAMAEKADVAARARQVDMAGRHCVRAYYDALDGLLVVLLTQCDDFMEAYPRGEVSRVLPDYARLCAEVEAVRQRWKAFGRVQAMGCETLTKRLHPLAKRLSDVLRDFRVAAASLDLRRDEAIRAREQKGDRQFVLSLMVSFFGLVLSLAVIALYDSLLLPTLIVSALGVLCHVRMGDLAIGRILRWTVYGFALLLAFLWVGCLLFGKARLMDWLGSIP